MPDILLSLSSLAAGYGTGTVISQIDLALEEGQSLAVLGRNGTGKTTLLNTIIGATRYQQGVITFRGKDITRLREDRRALLGIGWVPQERNIFRSLTVEENITAVALPGRWNLQSLFALFPRLEERRRNLGSQLSGGEQQMLAIARALSLNPSLLLLDEPTEGLAPIIVEELLGVLARLVREEGLSAIIVEQHAQKILDITDQAVVLDRGMIVHRAKARTLRDDPAALHLYLGVSGHKGGRQNN